MTHGEFKIVEQVGGRGYFGAIKLNAELTTNRGVAEIDFGPVRAEWHEALQFGADCVLFYLRNQKLDHGLRIEIVELRDFIIDTSFELVAHIFAQALYQAIAVQPDPAVCFDGNRFHFPLKKKEYGSVIPPPLHEQ